MTGDQMTLARLRAFTRAFNDHDIAALLTQVAGDVALSRGDGGTLSGQAALADLLQGLIVSCPDARLTPREMIAFGDGAVAAEWVFTGTQAGRLQLPWEGMTAEASGRKIEAAWAALVFFDGDGLISRLELRGDFAALLEAPAVAEGEVPSAAAIGEMAKAYAAAWSSGDPAAVGAHYAISGWISINGAAPSSGRPAVTEMAAGFMGAFPGMALTLDDLQISGNRVVLSWTLKGANTGPDGTGQNVRISGYEIWRLDADCRVAESHGYFDNAAYAHQLLNGAPSI